MNDKNLKKYLQEQNDKEQEWVKLGLKRKNLDYQEARVLAHNLKKFYEENCKTLKESYPEFMRRNGFWMNDHYVCDDYHLDVRPRIWIEDKGYLTV